MFSNIGSKVRKLTVFFFILGIIASISAAIQTIRDGDVLQGIIVFVVCALFVWIGSWMTYGIGVAADRTFKNDRGVFANISGKLKTIAIIMCVLGMLFSITSGVLMIVGKSYVVNIVSSYLRTPAFVVNYAVNGSTATVAGIVTIVVGSLVSWIGSWVTYAVGVAAERR